MSQTAYVGTTPTITDTIVNGNGQSVDLTGATVTWVYRPIDMSAPAVSIAATPDPDQVANEGVVSVTLGSPIMDAAAQWAWWWHVDFANSALLDTDNFLLTVQTHGPTPGITPYITPGLFRRLTRVRLSKLGIEPGGGDELLQEEIDRAAAYVEIVTGQPATSADLPVLATNIANGSALSDGVVRPTIRQAIQMRTEQVTYQSQRSYLEDATDDVVGSFSVGGYSQSKSDPNRRGEQRQLNSWQALSNVLWLLMTPDRYWWWVVFLSGDAHLMEGVAYGFENAIQPGWVEGWGYGFGIADSLIAGGYGSQVGIGGWQGNLGGLPGGIFPLLED